MSRTSHLSMTGAVIVCLVSTQLNGMLFASENEPLTTEVRSTQPSSTTSETQISERSIFTLRAGELTASPSLGPLAQGARRTFDFVPVPSNAFAGQIYQGQPYRLRHDGSIAAIMIGAMAAIAGGAILVYANRPDCEIRPYSGGCGYGTKVVGGAVLSGGIASLFVGALTWR